MSLSLWTADSAMAKGTPAVAIRILPPPPSVFTPVLEMANSYNTRKHKFYVPLQSMKIKAL